MYKTNGTNPGLFISEFSTFWLTKPPKCPEKVPDLSFFWPIWPTLGLNTKSVHCDEEALCFLFVSGLLLRPSTNWHYIATLWSNLAWHWCLSRRKMAVLSCNNRLLKLLVSCASVCLLSPEQVEIKYQYLRCYNKNILYILQNCLKM